MKPTRFPGCNVTFAEDQPEYLPLPARRDPDGCVTTKWKLTVRERVAALLTGFVWLQQLTFGSKLQPIKPSVGRRAPR